MKDEKVLTEWLKIFSIIAFVVFVFTASTSVYAGDNTLVHSGFKAFSQGRFFDAGSNLYVNAHGVIETINRLDVNDDGYPDLPLANSHDYIERAAATVFTLNGTGKNDWKRQVLPTDSGWMGRIVDLDKDGHNDLILVNGENGVTSDLLSYVYWGGENGIGNKRTNLSTLGAYDVAVMDINYDGNLDLIFPSAWEDHHNAGQPILAKVYLGNKNRTFDEATEKYGIMGMAAVAIAEADLNRDGFTDLVLGNYREGFNHKIDSFIYWGSKEGLNTQTPTRLPTDCPLKIVIADLNGDTWEDILFSGNGKVFIYRNNSGTFTSANSEIIEATGYTSMYSRGKVGLDVADMDGDNKNDLIMTTEDGIQIRPTDNLQKVKTFLPLSDVHYVTACDLNSDGKKDLIVSRYADSHQYDCESPVFWNGPSGFSIERATWFPTGGAVGNTAGDLDGDGKPEVIYCNTMSGHLNGIFDYIYLGNKDANYGIENR